MYFAEAILVGDVGARRLQRVGCCVPPRVGFSRKCLLNKFCLPSKKEFASFAFLLFVLQSSRRLRVGPA